MNIAEIIGIAESHLVNSENLDLAKLHVQKAKEWQEKGMSMFACTSALNSLYYSVGFVHSDYMKIRKILSEKADP